MKERKWIKRSLSICCLVCLIGTFSAPVYAQNPPESDGKMFKLEDEEEYTSSKEAAQESDESKNNSLKSNEATGDEETKQEDEDIDNLEQSEKESDAVGGVLENPIELDSDLKVKYIAHVQNIGWQNYVMDGDSAGTVGKNLSMEGLRIEIENPEQCEKINGSIEYRVHVSGIGWQNFVSDGEIAGTVGEVRAIEAIEIRLTGKISEEYDVYYRIHSAEYGWFDWAKNGELSGSMGFSLGAQAIEIKLFKKDASDKPIPTDKTYLSIANIGDIIYRTHIQEIGWTENKVDGQEAGNSLEDKNLEAIRINVSDNARGFGNLSGSIEYKVHIQDIGWQNGVSNGEQAGTTGKNKAIEAIKVNLTNQLSETYDVYYRVCSKPYGWFGWAKNGELSGSIGFAYPIKAIEIKLFKKYDSDKPQQTKVSYLTEENMGQVIYSAHIQNIGWQGKVADGKTAGTTGRMLGVEGIRVNISELGKGKEKLSGSIIYQAHVSNIGWQNEVKDGELAGTTGENKRIEALRIHLTDELADKYDVYYRVHASEFGWLGWAKNGETSGSTGYGSSAEAIQIKLIDKSSGEDLGRQERTYLSREKISKIEYQEHVEMYGWQSVKVGDDIIGTVGQSKGIEAIAMAIKPSGDTYGGSIFYNLHLANIGWQGWKSDGDIAGTVGQERSAEAIQIKLSGEMERFCDIYYRAHVSNFGWLGWAKNGDYAGTSGYGYKLEAIQVKVVPKHTNPPGSTNDAFRKAPPTVVMRMQSRADLYASVTPYLILVDRSTHNVGIFQGWQGNWNNIYFWACSDGAPNTPTVEGVFKVGSRGYYFDSGNARCYWWTQFYGNYLFHSVLYNKNGTLLDGRLGMPLSHGCVRMQIENAKWIYDNIPSGTTVVVYH